MSTPRLLGLQNGLRWRHALCMLALGLPWLLVGAAVLWRIAGAHAALVALAGSALALLVSAVWSACRIGLDRVVRGLDSAVPMLEDSSDLLLRDAAALSRLQDLQRERVGRRLAATTLPDLRPPWPARRIAASWLIAALAVIAVGQWPSSRHVAQGVPAAPAAAGAVPAATHIVSAHIDIEAPAYTALGIRSEAQLDLAAPVGSRLRWRLRFDGTPREVALSFHDGSRLALARDGEDWVGQRELSESTLYRVGIVDAPVLADDRLHRLDATPDQPPEIRMLEPERTLTLLDAAQTSWPLAFEANDDYGIAGARLQVTLAQGSGEQITVREQEVVLRAGQGGDVRHRRYRHRLDLAALGFAQGDDVIVRVSVSDTRTPQANVARSASFILRWPPDASAEAEGIDGVVQKVLPAYFRSQRQIIIDTEALLGERPRLDDETFVARSDAIGVDQKILRLRYGQFLGEEFESGGGPKPAGSDAAQHDDGHDEGHEGNAAHADTALPAGHTADDGHGHAGAAFGDAAAVTAEYGHVHDHAEAATLLDPETKRILKAALAEMWQAELHLRLGEPEQALPFENRALGYIKQVQQSTRIYLARVGLELPAVDESRRLSGERKDLRDRRGTLAAVASGSAPLADFERALSAGQDADPTAFDAWLRTHGGELPDALAVIAALDGWRNDRACVACREHLLDTLWPLLAAPAARNALRERPDASGDAYLDALRSTEPR